MKKGLSENYKKSIIEVAKIYNDNINNVEITYTYIHEGNQKKKIKLAAKDSNFMHLCGISSYGEEMNSKNAKNFFNDCIDEKLSVRNIWYSNIDKVDMKLRVLKNLELLLKKGVCVCGRGEFEKLTFEGAIRSDRIILAVTIKDGGIPNSIIDLRTNKANTETFKKKFRVIKIERYDKKNNRNLPDINIEFNKRKKKDTKKEIREKKRRKKEKDRGNH